MTIFVINSGSSSIKYQLFHMPSDQPVCSGLVERIGLEDSVITHRVFTDGGEKTIRRTTDLADHSAGLEAVVQLLTDPAVGVIRALDEINAVGHRVVHGGEQFAATVVVTPEVKQEVQQLFPLAPLHNPANYLGIEVAERIFPGAKQVAVFDTAFHQTMPERVYRYAIPEEFYSQLHIRAYGFHGTSHKYVSKKATAYLGNPGARLITVHLGNGCSMAAIRDGACLDTSMGMGPLSGLIMGTRSGDIDPSVIFYLLNQRGYEPEQVNTLLNKRSGMLGLTGHSDMRDVTQAIAQGDPRAALAYDMYAYRIKKYVGAYVAVLNGLDALIFTAGVGENDPEVRARVCQNLDYLGIRLDEEKNRLRTPGLREISAEDSRVKILLIPTNEELLIARDTLRLIGTTGSDD